MAIALIVLAPLCVIGIAFIIFSNPGVLGDSRNYAADMAIGVSLAFGAVILVNLKDVVPNDRGRELSMWLSEKGLAPNAGRTPHMVSLLIPFLISSLGASVVCAVVGFARGEDLLGNLAIVGWASVGGIFVNAIAGILWRYASPALEGREGTREGSISLAVWTIAIPVFALSFLFLTPLIPFASSLRDEIFDVEHFEYFVLGATAVLAANLIASYIDEVKLAFETLILGLVGCGTLVYFREDLFNWLGIWIGSELGWSWPEGAYFGSIAMSATVFALILAFRVARQVTRTTAEENLTFTIMRNLDALEKRGVIVGPVREQIFDIDVTNEQWQLQEKYREARRLLSEVEPSDSFEYEMLRDVEAELDMLVRSQQVSTSLGELFALLIFSGITVFLTLFTKPDIAADGTVQNWIPFGVDLFAMLVSSVIAFLMIYSIDLDRDRDATKLEPNQEGVYEIKFNVAGSKDNLADQWLSGVAGGIIIVVYIGLLAHKWLWT